MFFTFLCSLIEEAIIRHNYINNYEELQKYDIDFSKYIIDQVKETEEYKKIFYSIYTSDTSDTSNITLAITGIPGNS